MKSNYNLNNFALYQKATEICQLTEALATTISDDEPLLESTKIFMLKMRLLFLRK